MYYYRMFASLTVIIEYNYYIMFYFIKLVTIIDAKEIKSSQKMVIYIMHPNTSVVINMAIVSTGMDIKYTLVLLYINMFNCSFY